MESSVLICTVFGRWYARCTRCACTIRSMKGSAYSARTSSSDQSCRIGGSAASSAAVLIATLMGISPSSRPCPRGANRVNDRSVRKSTFAQWVTRGSHGAADSRCTSRAAATPSAPSTATSTAAAAQSLTTRTPGLCCGCSTSARCSMAVLKSSAATTAALASSTSAHHTAGGRTSSSTSSAAAPASACTLRLASLRRAWAKPRSAKPSRARKRWFLWLSMGRASGSVGVLEEYADEHREAHVLVIEEGAQAAGGLALADQPLLPGKQQRRAEHSSLVPTAEVHAATGEDERAQHDQLHHADEEAIHVREQDGARFHPELQIVLSIDHGIDRVVDRRP